MDQNQQTGHATRTNNYHAYLLRLWRESSHGAWRAMLQDVATGQRHGFGGLAALWLHLCAQTGEDVPGSDEPALPSKNYQEEEPHD